MNRKPLIGLKLLNKTVLAQLLLQQSRTNLANRAAYHPVKLIYFNFLS